MPSEPAVELRRLRESSSFRTYEVIRRMSMCYGMMDSKLSELIGLVSSVRSPGRSGRSSYRDLESSTMELCQTLSDFLSRMYACKNLASVCAKRHGVDPAFKLLKHSMLGFEASVMVNLRNYIVHVDMLPLEIDISTGAVVFTRRCRGDDIWSTPQKRFLKDTDLETLLTVYSDVITAFYAEYFSILLSAVHPKLGACKQEIGELNRRLGYEMVRFDPLAGMRARSLCQPYCARARIPLS